jgi:peptide/nickel transport system permease protein
MSIRTTEPTGRRPADPITRPGSRLGSRLWRSRQAWIAGTLFLLIVLACVVIPVFYPADPLAQDLLHRFEGPSAEHWLGTDHLGRDMFARVFIGGQTTILAAAGSVLIAAVIGIVLGTLAGYVGRWADQGLTLVNDTLMALPGLILALAVVAIAGPGLTNAMIAIGVLLSPRLFRTARAAVSSIRREDFVESARLAGCSEPRVLWRHVLPNTLLPLATQLTFVLAIALTAEAGLSFLGLGAIEPQLSWGSVLKDGFDNIRTDAFPIFPPAVLLALTTVALALFVDAVQDAFGRSTIGKTARTRRSE